jgi:galactokinase
MARKTPYNQPQSQRAAALPRLRAMRFENRNAEIERRIRALGFDREALQDPSVLRRLRHALRAERRAARAGSAAYDPLRHLALARLGRELKKTAGREAKGCLAPTKVVSCVSRYFVF